MNISESFNNSNLSLSARGLYLECLSIFFRSSFFKSEYLYEFDLMESASFDIAMHELVQKGYVRREYNKYMLTDKDSMLTINS